MRKEKSARGTTRKESAADVTGPLKLMARLWAIDSRARCGKIIWKRGALCFLEEKASCIFMNFFEAYVVHEFKRIIDVTICKVYTRVRGRLFKCNVLC